MISKIVLAAFVVAAPLALGACNASQPTPQAVVTQPGRVAMTPQDFKLPEGAGCSGDVARYRAVMANDRETGNVNDRVFRQISSEIDSAAAVCSAGQDGQARALIRTSKARHGYPG